MQCPLIMRHWNKPRPQVFEYNQMPHLYYQNTAVQRKILRHDLN